MSATDTGNADEWAGFLAAYVDFNHGKGISDRAWDCYLGTAHDDERPPGVSSPAARKAST